MLLKKTLTLISIIIAILLTGCSSNGDSDIKNDVSKALGVDVSSAEISESIDTHGGFHGDGTTFVSMEITDEATAEKIKTEWNELPLTENLTALVYGVKEDTSSIGPYVTEDGETLFPQIENGYYYFNDRHSESNDGSDDADVLNRHSFNFIISIFDTDTNRLYYCKFDT